MIDWGSVGAFTAPLVGSIGLVAGWFTYQGRKRDQRVAEQIREATAALEKQQALTQEQLTQVKTELAQQARHLDKQDDVLSAALQAIARIEGRLLGPVSAAPG